MKIIAVNYYMCFWLLFVMINFIKIKCRLGFIYFLRFLRKKRSFNLATKIKIFPEIYKITNMADSGTVTTIKTCQNVRNLFSRLSSGERNNKYCIYLYR